MVNVKCIKWDRFLLYIIQVSLIPPLRHRVIYALKTIPYEPTPGPNNTFESGPYISLFRHAHISHESTSLYSPPIRLVRTAASYH